MQSAAKRHHIVRLGSWLILVLALMPNISYMGHWPDMAGTANHHDEAAAADPNAAESELEAHAAHCHVGPAHCGGGESMIGTPFVGETGGGMALPGQETNIDNALTLLAPSGHPTQVLRPPQAA